METRVDNDTALKIEKINRKIEEINQRRNGLHTTKIEDDLDRQELDEYINTLNLTSEQKSMIQGYQNTNARMVKNQSVFYYGMMIISVFTEAYLGYAIISMILTPNLDMFNTIFLYMMIAVFIINAVYVLRFLRILK
ncbi:conserved hypothetical protein [Methanocella paludicola SANAE]|uniref:Uncharacterized protein n=1 Tax=Methanocella paludicola (strain DSM 17711 / JCM 13418 / NBRC 101707 / SANAE) TaxID=304371 RepID=D1YXC0_METPS|nr:hypothetical protein [Methanocella paludicola]BAI61092.1 conserved hypothetical protein [Methanocella paludicola SANAE]